MNLGIVIDDYGLNNMNFSDISRGNPGVGGTLFEELLLANSIKDEVDIKVCLYVTNKDNIYFDGVEIVCLNNEQELFEDAKNRNIDLILYCTGKKANFYDLLQKSEIKCIAWAHGFLNYYELKKIKKISNIKCVVFVGKSMYYNYIADDIIKKSTFIYNMINSNDEEKRKEYYHDVCYLGALNRYKGFHILAKAWPYVLKEIPDAQLYVIGKGTLYNRNSKLGKYEIAEKSYERRFIEYLLNEKGEIDSSVHFLGNLGKEKNDFIKKMCVGVVNPTAVTETFCISAIELNAFGVPVCTKGAYGLLDTVENNKTGLFSNNYIELSNNIIKLLKDKKLNDTIALNAINNSKRFETSKIIPHWKNLFDKIIKEEKMNSPILNDSNIKIPFWKKILHILRINKKLFFLPSFVRFDYLSKGMMRVYFRDMIYHYCGKDKI